MADWSLPFGCKFQPDDRELIAYLSLKTNGQSLPSEGDNIKEVDIYTLIDPGKLFQRSQQESVYVITKVKKTSPNGKRVDRKVAGNRTWKGVDKGHPIYDQEGRLVGEKNNFNFMNKMKMKLGYNMTEFVLDKGTLSAAKFKEYVLCNIKRIIKKGRSLQEEDSCSSRTSMEEEHNASLEDESNSSSDVDLMPEKSLLNRSTVPFHQFASDLVNKLTSDAVPFPQPAADQHCCQDFLVNNALLLPESAEQYCQFSGFQDGTTSEQMISMTVFDKAMIGSEFLEASADRMCDPFSKFAQNQEQEAEHNEELVIWRMINELT